MKRLIFAWLGKADLDAAAGKSKAGQGPILEVISQRTFDELHLLVDWSDAVVGHGLPPIS